MLKYPFDNNKHWFRQFYYRQTIGIICRIVDRYIRWFTSYAPGLLQRRHVARREIVVVMDKNFRFIERCMKTSSNGQMETFSVLLAPCAENSPVTGEFPTPRPVTRSFDVFFDLRLE